MNKRRRKKEWKKLARQGYVTQDMLEHYCKKFFSQPEWADAIKKSAYTEVGWWSSCVASHDTSEKDGKTDI